MLDAITSGASELLDDEVVGLRLIDDDDPETMVMVSALGIADDLRQGLRRLPVGTGVGGQAIVEDRLCMTDDYASWTGAIAGFVAGGLRSAMATPVRLKGRPIGSLVVASHERGRTYSVPEQEILIAFAEHASLALIDAASVQAMNDALRAAVHDAMHDQLTGLPHRACFYERTEQALAVAGDGTCTAVLLFDLDRFKEINDSLGHRYGDRVLCAIGPRIRATLRDEDTLARLGGDEFCVLLPSVQGPAAAVEVARRVIALIEQPFDVDGLKLAVEASCGVAVAPVDGDSADLLLQRADVAMYAAKHAHAGVVAYDDSLNVMTPARLVMLAELRTAIAAEELVLEYQPQAAMGSERVEGVEALVRWRHPALGLVPPDQFIPLAERTGLIKALTTWVLDTALCQRRRWLDGTDPGVPDELTVAVNISSRSLLDESFLDEVVAALDRWDVPARLLTLEVTETTIMADPPRAYRLLRRLAATGMQLAIDDFGTGYSSLAHLKNLPVAELKIDKSFVLHMHRDPNDAIIVRSVIDLARNLGLRTVAEGVEDLDTWAQLAALGSAPPRASSSPVPSRPRPWVRGCSTTRRRGAASRPRRRRRPTGDAYRPGPGDTGGGSGRTKCGFSITPTTAPSGATTVAVRIPSPTSTTASATVAPSASSDATATSASATPQ